MFSVPYDGKHNFMLGAANREFIFVEQGTQRAK